MTTQSLHTFSDSGLHTALLVALLLLAVGANPIPKTLPSWDAIRTAIHQHPAASADFSEPDIASIVRWCADKHELDAEPEPVREERDEDEAPELSGAPSIDDEPRPPKGEPDDDDNAEEGGDEGPEQDGAAAAHDVAAMQGHVMAAMGHGLTS